MQLVVKIIHKIQCLMCILVNLVPDDLASLRVEKLSRSRVTALGCKVQRTCMQVDHIVMQTE